MNNLSNFISERTRNFTGREWVFGRLNDWLSGSSRTFLLTGEPGSGKSAFAGRMVQMSSGTVQNNRYPRLGTNCLAFHHFCQAMTNTTIDPLLFIKDLALKLAERYPVYGNALLNVGEQNINISTRQTIGTASSKIVGLVIEELHVGNISSQAAFDRIIRAPLEKLCTIDFKETVLILVDALDESLAYDSHNTLVALLGSVARANTDLPSQIRFVFTSRPDLRVLHHIGGSSLDLIDDAPAGVNDVRMYAYRRLLNVDVKQRKRLAARVADAGKGNFLYARYVLNDLISEAQSVTDLDSLKLPQGLDEVYRQFLKRTLANHLLDWTTRYRPLLGILAVAHGNGLTAVQLAGIANLLQSEADDILTASAQYLNGPEPDGSYSIYHQSFRQFLLADKTYFVYPAEANEKIARYFLLLYGSNWLKCSEVYAIQYTPTHLRDALTATDQQLSRKELVNDLVELLTDFSFVEAKVAKLGVDGMLADLCAIDSLEFESEARANAKSLRRVLDREAHNLRGWDFLLNPVYLGQQMNNWAIDLDLHFLISAAAHRLEQIGKPYLNLVWRAARESRELERILSGHTSAVVALTITERDEAFSIDERNTLRHWDVQSGQNLHVFHGKIHDPMTLVKDAALTADGRYAIVALWDQHALEIWNLQARELMYSIPEGAAGARAVAIGPNGRYGVVAHAKDELKVWDLTTGQPVRTIYDPGLYAECLASSPDGKVLGESPIWQLKLWHLETGEVLQTFVGHGDSIFAMAFNHDGSLAATASADAIKLWNINTGELLQNFQALTMHQNYINALTFSRDGQRLLSASADATIAVWDIQTGQPEYALYGHAGSISSLATTSDGRYAVSGSGDHTLRVWNLESYRPAHRRVGHTDEVNGVAISLDGQSGVSCADDGLVKTWDLETGRLLHDLTDHQGKVNAVAITPDGLTVISASDDKTMRAWDIRTGAQLRVFIGHTEGVVALRIASHGEFIISGSKDGTVGVWNMQQEHPFHILEHHDKSVLALALSPDNRHAASSSSDGAVRLWDVDSGEEFVYRGPDHKSWVRDVTFVLNGRFVVSASDDCTLKVWDVSRDRIKYTLTGHTDWVRIVKGIPNSTCVISASSDHTVKVWDLLNGKLEHDLVGHTAPVYDVVTSSDGRLAASVSSDRTLRIWDLSTGREVAMTALDGKLNCVRWASDSGLLLVGDWGGNVYCLRYIDRHIVRENLA